MMHLQVKEDGGVVGRFAPSPTGDLHFGSLVAALGSYLDCRSRGGEWLVRVENIDPPREVSGAGQRQIEALARHGMVSDREVVWQIDSTAIHQDAIEQLIDQGKAFPCGCTRADLPPGGVYPGTCRDGLSDDRQARSVRLQVTEKPVHFNDRILGPRCQQPAAECGDFVIRRADGLVAYQLAVVVDDALAGVTDIVRGQDLIDSTARQILVYKALELKPPRYAHLPVITDQYGRKLSKSEADDPIQTHNPVANLKTALRCLGHPAPTTIVELPALMTWAIEHWNLDRVPHGPCAVDMPAQPS